ncbi:MAG: desulfoferrodoxin family protein [Clostridia bacterium]|nr:desulfoferrodoxin family protein [Clostridia bacterium]
MEKCKNKFFICKHCGNLVGLIEESGVPMVCCGEKMTELVANTTEAAVEKHVPVVTVDGNTVKVAVGSVAHPMIAAHYIKWVYLMTDKGGQRKCLKPDMAPEVSFALCDEKPLAVYAYCNLHGLWMVEL